MDDNELVRQFGLDPRAEHPLQASLFIIFYKAGNAACHGLSMASWAPQERLVLHLGAVSQAAMQLNKSSEPVIAKPLSVV